MLKPVVQVILMAALIGSCALWSQEPANGSRDAQTAPDNTKTNQRDRNASEPTADQQSENQADRELTQQIRRAIVRDKELSTYAHNVKIIAQNGEVTLKGPVKSEQEKKAIARKAAEVVGGAGKVHNELEVMGEGNDKPSEQ